MGKNNNKIRSDWSLIITQAQGDTNVDIATSTSQDSGQMRSISLVTMVFLPGTFFAVSSISPSYPDPTPLHLPTLRLPQTVLPLTPTKQDLLLNDLLQLVCLFLYNNNNLHIQR